MVQYSCRPFVSDCEKRKYQPVNSSKTLIKSSPFQSLLSLYTCKTFKASASSFNSASSTPRYVGQLSTILHSIVPAMLVIKKSKEFFNDKVLRLKKDLQATLLTVVIIDWSIKDVKETSLEDKGPRLKYLRKPKSFLPKITWFVQEYFSAEDSDVSFVPRLWSWCRAQDLPYSVIQTRSACRKEKW